MKKNSVASVDKNLKIITSIDKDDIVFLDVKEKPFDLYGFCDYKNSFLRMPMDVAKATSPGVEELTPLTAGGRVRFATDSKYIAIKVQMPRAYVFPHMTIMGSAGFDIYIDGEGESLYERSFFPPVDSEQKVYETYIEFSDRKLRYFTLNFPLYSPVDNLYIGLQNDAEITEGKKYKDIKPVLFYGSSITQGGCVSRPGLCYQGYLSRSLDIDYINLGFSGNGKAEDSIVDYMKTLDISAFVCDYDWNAPDSEYLKNTHEKMFLKFREKMPDLPVIFMSAPVFRENDEFFEKRRDIIFKTYENAVAKGDENVYFIDGSSFFTKDERDSATVDMLHPNDIGHFCMARALKPILEKALGNIKEV